MNLNSSPSHFSILQITHDNDHELYHHQPFLQNLSPSVSCHFFFDQTQDHARFYHYHQLYRPNHGDEDYGGSTYEIKSKVDSGLKLGLWKEENDEGESNNDDNNNHPMKWMSSKMRVMQKMKHASHDRAALKITCSADHKTQPSASDLSSNSSSCNKSPIRVCSDCNTTKTPLWRSGPKGPKSLCNACGIRQRKARRAMASAAAAANGATANTSDQSTVKIKLQNKGKIKKRCKTAIGSPSNGKKQLGFEDFLINLSKNLAFHCVFPDEEKDAAILLMALSSGLVNG